MAAVVLVGGDGCVRVRAREREQRGGASRKSERGPRGWRGAPSDVQEQAARMRWPARARASGTRPPAYWQEVEDGGDCGGLGRTVLDQHRSWAGSGGLHG